MSKATRLVGVAVTFSLLTSLVVGSATVAASSAPFRISGAVAPISGPDAFTGASVQRATSAQTAVVFTYVSYFVVTDPTGARFTLIQSRKLDEALWHSAHTPR